MLFYISIVTQILASLQIIYNQPFSLGKLGNYSVHSINIINEIEVIKLPPKKVIKARRGHNEGSVSYDKKNNSYRAAFSAPDGKRVFKRFKEESNAWAWITEQKHLVNQGAYIPPSRMNLGEWIIYYIDTYVQKKVRTISYESSLRLCRYIIPVAHIPLQDITSEDLQNQINQLNDLGYSASTQKKVKNLLKSSLKKAVSERLIPFNPADSLSSPVVLPKDVETFTQDEFAKLLKFSEGHILSCWIILGGTCGLRSSELLGLFWEDINFQTGEISIQRSRVRTQTRGVIMEEPKTKKSRRKMSLSPFARVYLKDFQRDTGPIFITSVGTIWTERNVDRWFEALTKKAGVLHRSKNTLRHTHATMLLQANVPLLEVSSRLGHSTPMTSLNRYGHTIPSKDKPIARKADTLLGLGTKRGTKPPKKAEKATSNSLKEKTKTP